MGITINSQAVLDDVVDWVVHADYCQRVISVTAPAAITKGTSLVGYVVYSANSGSTWKIIEAADNLAAANVMLAVLIPSLKVVADVAAAGTITGLKAIYRGPCRIHKAGLVVGAANLANVVAQLVKQGIQVLDESGLAYNPGL